MYKLYRIFFSLSAFQCSLSYHHFESVEDTTRVLSFFLKPGGVLIIGDFMRPKEDGKPLFSEEYHHVVPHHNAFEEDQIRGVFEGAGLVDFVFIPEIYSTNIRGKDVDLFIAKGTKPQV